MNIAVVDSGGNLVAHVRQDGAWIGSVNISINKAWTSKAFDISTKDLGDNSQPTQQFFGIHATNGGKVAIFAGGIPLSRDGVVVGAVGVSGGSGEQDHASPRPATPRSAASRDQGHQGRKRAPFAARRAALSRRWGVHRSPPPKRRGSKRLDTRAIGGDH